MGIKMSEKRYTINDLLEIMETLRSPNGCPWDKVQTHESIKKSMIEESYEAIDALDSGDDKAFANELGDVLLQVVFHAQIAKGRNAFDFDDVVNEICTKLVTRHTHVFGKEHAGDEKEALDNWEKNKKKEKGLKTYTETLRDVPKYYPALMRAEKVQKKAKGAGFDWDNIADVYAKVYEEADEIKEAQSNGTAADVEEEYGDFLFAAVNLGRFLGVTPETALTKASEKFIDRFEKMENKAKADGKELSSISLDEMDRIWDEIKHLS